MDRHELEAIQAAVLERVARRIRLLQVAIGELVGVHDDHSPGLQVAQVDRQRSGVHGHQHAGPITGRVHVVAGEVDLEAADTGLGAGRGADLGRKVGEGGQVIALQRCGPSELVAGELHAVAGVAREADDDVVDDLPGAGGCRRGHGHGGHSLLLESAPAASRRREREAGPRSTSPGHEKGGGRILCDRDRRFPTVGRSQIESGLGGLVKYRLLQWLACPVCGAPDLSVETTATRTVPILPGQYTAEETELPGVDSERRTEQEVMAGALHCVGCGAVFPIRDGIPRLMPPGGSEGPRTAHRVTEIDPREPAWEDNFRDLAEPLTPADFLGRLVLDAGAGFGRHALHAARYGAEVVALDSSIDAVESCARNCADLARVHVIQGDLQHPPLREGIFDIVYCFGVLHHLEEPRDAFLVLGTLLRPGGTLALWVYGARQGLTRHASNALRGMTTNLDPAELQRVSRWIARGLRLFSHTPYRLLGKVPVAGDVVSHLPVHDHARWPFDVVTADIYDRLRIPVHHWFTGEELEAWLMEAGYANIRVSRRVRNNETFRVLGQRR